MFSLISIFLKWKRCKDRWGEGKKIIWRRFKGERTFVCCSVISQLQFSSAASPPAPPRAKAIAYLRNTDVPNSKMHSGSLSLGPTPRAPLASSSWLLGILEWRSGSDCTFRGLNLKYLVLSTFVWPVLLAVILYFLLHINQATVSGMSICVHECNEWVFFFSSGRLNAVNSQMITEQWPVSTVRQKTATKKMTAEEEWWLFWRHCESVGKHENLIFLFSLWNPKKLFVNINPWKCNFILPNVKKRKDFQCDLPSLGDINCRHVCLLLSRMHKWWPGYSR